MSEGGNPDYFENMEYSLRLSWETHRQAFGPILEPAFKDDMQSRIQLILALNHISRRETDRGFEVLNSIKECCVNDADTAAWTFFWGLCCEFAGNGAEAMYFYEQAGAIGHSFYLPWLKLAKAEHSRARFGKARAHYENAIKALLSMSDDDKEEAILGSAYTNLTSCLTMMHLYSEAEQNWKKSLQYPQQPGAAASGAIMYAAMGESEKTDELLEQLREKFPVWLGPSLELIQGIREGTHPHFSHSPMAMNSPQSFWDWFVKYEQILELGDAYAVKALKQQISRTIPGIGREPELSLQWQNQRGYIAFSDFYGLGLHYAYSELFKDCPAEVTKRWSFSIVHEL